MHLEKVKNEVKQNKTNIHRLKSSRRRRHGGGPQVGHVEIDDECVLTRWYGHRYGRDCPRRWMSLHGHARAVVVDDAIRMDL